MISKFADSPALKKFLILSGYALLGAAAQAGLIPVSVVEFVRDHVIEVVALSVGLGHILPEAGRAQK